MGDNSGSLTFREILDASVMNLGSGTSLTIVDVLVGLISSLLCAVTIFWVYRETYQGVLYQRSFNISLVMVSLVTTSVIMVIAGNLVLSLGMVGALSIVRFRAAVKDPLDITFIFWAIAVGIANGVANIRVSFTSTLFLAIVIFVISRMKYRSIPHILIVQYDRAVEGDVIKKISGEVRKYSIKSKTTRGQSVELTVELRLGREGMKIVDQVSALDGVNDATLLAYNDGLVDN